MSPVQTRLTMPIGTAAPVMGIESESPFLRPKSRTRVRRRRRGGWARAALALQVVAAASIVVGSLLWSYHTIVTHERLRIVDVDVHGSRFLSEGEVRELLQPAVGENILTVDIAALLERLNASPWVARATVRRTLPDRLQVDIQERVPLALAEVEQLYLMDEDGGLIDLYGPRTAGFDLPIVRGLAEIDGEARRDRAQRAGMLLADLGDLAVEVSEVEVEPSGDLRIVLRRHGEVLRVSVPPYREKFLTYLGLREQLLERAPDAEYFDLRFRDRIYAKRPLGATRIAADATVGR